MPNLRTWKVIRAFRKFKIFRNKNKQILRNLALRLRIFSDFNLKKKNLITEDKLEVILVYKLHMYLEMQVAR